MRTALRTLGLVSAISALAQTPAPPKPAPGFTWPVPTGWDSETFTFPLQFAPSLPHKGLEEIRFSPGFFKPDQPDWWSYTFVWWLEDPRLPDGPTLEKELTLYFKGLCEDVAGKKYTLDPARYRTRLQLVHFGTIYQGEIDTYDPFRTGKPITLHVRIGSQLAGNHHVLRFMLSPQPLDAPVWAELQKVQDGFKAP